MRSFFVLVPLFLAMVAPTAAGQSAVPGVRLIEARTEPASPGFGEVATLAVELRLAPGLALFVADTLSSARDMAGVAPGSWTAAPGPADSLTAIGRYQVIGFREGIQELPKLELGVATLGSADATSPVLPLSQAPAEANGGLRTALIPLGSTTISAYAPIDDAPPDAVLAPRPPADVVGGEWSVWLILGVGLASAAGVGGVGAILPRWWSRRGAALMARFRGHSPKLDALRELERIRALGWHRDGRIDDFYSSSTDTLRDLAVHFDPSWSRALTVSELVLRLEERWGQPKLDRVAGALATAERVKFGTLQPDADAAETDWAVMRDWVRGLPEG